MGTNFRGRDKVYASRGIHQLVTDSGQAKKIEWASASQQELFEYGPAPVCASGGFGSSKSWGACLKALYLSDLYPGNRGVIARRVWDELKKTTMATFFNICPPNAYSFGGRRADSDKILRLNNGSEILWLHLDDPETENVIRGLEINWFFIDQAEEVDEEIFELMLRRLGRWNGAHVPAELIAGEQAQGRDWPWRNKVGQAIPPTYPMIACNPDHELHWIYRRFHPESDEHWEKRVKDVDPNTGKWSGRFLSYRDLGYRMINFDSLDNKFLPDQARLSLLQSDESFVARFVRGKWGLADGQIHTVAPVNKLQASQTVPVRVSPEEVIHLPLLDWIRQHCSLMRVMDYGDSAPTSCLWLAADRDGNLIFYREYYRPNAMISDHRAAIVERSEGEKYDMDQADPSIFTMVSQKQGGRWTVADEWRDSDVLPKETALYWQPADNNEFGTRDRINELLRVDPRHKHPVTGELGAPRLYFVEKTPGYEQGCYFAIRETNSQRREKVGSDMGKPIFSDNRDPHIPDHAYDCVRYGVAARPRASALAASKPHPQSFAEVRKRMINWRKSGAEQREIRSWTRRRATSRAYRR